MAEKEVEQNEIDDAQIETMIKESLDKSKFNMTASEKAMQTEALKKIMINGSSPKEAIGLNDEFMELIYSQAYNLYNLGQYKEASEFFKFLATLEPESAKYHLGLAASYHLMKDYESAIIVYRVAAHFDPTSPLPHYHIYDCYEKLGDDVSAFLNLKIAIRTSEGNPKYKEIQARCITLANALKDKIIAERNGTDINEEGTKKEETAGGIFDQFKESKK